MRIGHKKSLRESLPHKARVMAPLCIGRMYKGHSYPYGVLCVGHGDALMDRISMKIAELYDDGDAEARENVRRELGYYYVRLDWTEEVFKSIYEEGLSASVN